MNLRYGIAFSQLYERGGLLALDRLFLQELGTASPELLEQLRQAREQPESLTALQESTLLIALGPHLENFIAGLFGIEDALAALETAHHELAPLYIMKRQFVQRAAAKNIRSEEAQSIDGPALREQLAAWFGGAFDELTFARTVQQWLQDKDANAEKLETARRYAGWAVHTAAGQAYHRGDILFRVPHGVDPMDLVPTARKTGQDGHCAFTIDPAHIRRREGFALTDSGMGLRGALDQANYCIFCHEQGRDSCSKGLKEKAPKDAPPLTGKNRFRKSVFQVTLAGCPLSEKISEFHQLKASGHAIAALAMIVVDNPMVAATGHRICNDCLKACIYQKQDAVDIPQIETRSLKDVLELPYGFEVYSLLTRWNPLNLRRPYPRERTGYRVLVTGLGPAGFTLAHYLMNEGHTVVGIDGLKIEPLPPHIGGVAAGGERVAFVPVRDIGTNATQIGRAHV